MNKMILYMVETLQNPKTLSKTYRTYIQFFQDLENSSHQQQQQHKKAV